MESNTRTRQILRVMLVLSIITFIGFMIEAGALLVTFGISSFNPEAARNLYNGLNLYELRQFNLSHYSLQVFLMALLAGLKAYVWLVVFKTIMGLNLVNPFKMENAYRLEKISYVLFASWIVSLLINGHSIWLLDLAGKNIGNEVSGDYIFMAGLIFIISQIFKRGVEMQSENELTV